MTKRNIEDDLRRFNNGKPFIAKRKLREWYGHGDNLLNQFLEGLDFVQRGNRKEYYIGDIAEQVMKERIL